MNKAIVSRMFSIGWHMTYTGHFPTGIHAAILCFRLHTVSQDSALKHHCPTMYVLCIFHHKTKKMPSRYRTGVFRSQGLLLCEDKAKHKHLLHAIFIFPTVTFKLSQCSVRSLVYQHTHEKHGPIPSTEPLCTWPGPPGFPGSHYSSAWDPTHEKPGQQMLSHLLAPRSEPSVTLTSLSLTCTVTESKRMV